MKILIADDEKPLVEILKEILRQNNMDCDAVYNGSDAVDFALNGDYVKGLLYNQLRRQSFGEFKRVGNLYRRLLHRRYNLKKLYNKHYRLDN